MIAQATFKGKVTSFFDSQQRMEPVNLIDISDKVGPMDLLVVMVDAIDGNIPTERLVVVNTEVPGNHLEKR